MNPFASELPNDPMLAHHNQVSSRKVKRAPDAEMTNPASDPFMVNQVRGMGNRPRVKVSILTAKGLPERGSNATTYATCMAKNKKNSSFRTRDSNDATNPVWADESGQMLMRWVPGDTLLFRIFDKDRSGMMSSLMSSEVLVAQCEIRTDEYYPDGLRGNLPLYNARGHPIPGSQLQVHIEIYGAETGGMMHKLARMCNCQHLDMASIKSHLNTFPETLIGLLFGLLGEPAEGRNKGDMALLILVPLVFFLFITWIGWVILHFNAIALTGLAVLSLLVAAGFVLMGVTTHKQSKTPFFSLGSLMAIAIVLALYSCHHGWNESWRQWWWIHTGIPLGATASTPAESRSDSSTLLFDTVNNGTQWTSVDATRAAGFRKGGDVYCAAPILDPQVAGGDIMRVNYWAIGINCCDDFGAYTCDAAREIKGGTGVVMKGGGMPCFGCNANEFRLAAAKAAGVNGMVSAPGALYVRFVQEPKTIENYYLSTCIFSFFWTLLFGLSIMGFLGFLCNYKGWGKPGNFPIYHLLDHKRPTGQANYVDDKKWTLVLTPHAVDGAVNMGVMKPEDNLTYGT